VSGENKTKQAGKQASFPFFGVVYYYYIIIKNKQTASTQASKPFLV